MFHCNFKENAKRSILTTILAIAMALCCIACAGRDWHEPTSTPKVDNIDDMQSITPDVSTESYVHFEGISVQPGDHFIDAAILDSDMNETSIAQVANGKPTYLIFWEEWCPQCKAEFKFIESVYQDYKDKVNFIVLHRMDPLTSDNKVALDFLAENNCSMPIYYNVRKEATAAYGSPSIPTNIFIRPDGTIYDAYTDVYDMTEDEVRTCLNAIVDIQ